MLARATTALTSSSSNSFLRPAAISLRLNKRNFSVMAPSAVTASVKPAEDFLSFINASPTPFHAVQTSKIRLEEAGYARLRERDSWAGSVVPGGKYYVTRNSSTIVAFAVGKRWRPGNPFAMVGAHTDSCALRLKPVSNRSSEGFIQIGVETYGGGMWHTWFDRDLGIAGRVMCRTDTGAEQKLVRLDRPIARIPSLAVHFGGSVPFEFNKESNLYPIAGLVEAELRRQGKTAEESKKTVEDGKGDEFHPLKTPAERHLPYLLEQIAAEAGVDYKAIEDFELILYDVQKSTLGGLNNEFIYSGRLDNLEMTYCAIQGLINSTGPNGKSLEDETTIRLAAAFDHEEIGSTSAQGADSNVLPSILRRLSCLSSSSALFSAETDSDASYDTVSNGKEEPSRASSTAFERALSSSFLISADMAHSVNPNYAAKHEPEHKPHMNKGTVIKINSNVRYATSTPGIVLLQELARRAKRSSYDVRTEGSGVPLQLFVVKNDSPCGSTIGPMLSANTGVRTLDLGNAQLAMHSIRETGGTYDIEHALNLFESFYEHYGELESKIFVD